MKYFETYAKRIEIIRIAAISILLLIFSLLIYFDKGENIDQQLLYDRLQGSNQFNNNILILAIDDKSINEIGRWPWDRDIYSDLIKLKEASIIGVDISFFEPSNKDENLSYTLNQLQNKAVLVNEISDKIYSPVFEADSGYANLRNDLDGVIRKAFFQYRGNYSFAEKVYLNYLKTDFTKTEYSQNLDINKLYLDFSNSQDIPTYSFTDFYHNRLNISFKNKIVLIGATAPDLHDEYLTPNSKNAYTPGIVVHANILSNMFTKSFITYLNSWIIFIFLLIVLGSFYKLKDIKETVFLSIVIFILILFLSFGLFYSKIMLPFSLLILCLGLLTLNNIVAATLHNKHKKQFVEEVFHKYISKDVLNEIVNNPSKLNLGGQKKEIGILFMDVRGFTTISEKLSPEKVVYLLNTYFKDATKVIMDNKGFIDKFIGDAIMALWNAPLEDKEFAYHMLISAVEMKHLVTILSPRYKKELDVDFNVGIGLNLGDAVVGNLGGEEKINYTAIGDSVNLASRLESLTKHYGAHIIISEYLYDKLKTENRLDKFVIRKLDYIKVKGKNKPIYIYQVIGYSDEKIPEGFFEYETAFEQYKQKKFDSAQKTLLKYDKDIAAKALLERIEKLEKSDLSNWDGSYAFESK